MKANDLDDSTIHHHNTSTGVQFFWQASWLFPSYVPLPYLEGKGFSLLGGPSFTTFAIFLFNSMLFWQLFRQPLLLVFIMSYVCYESYGLEETSLKSLTFLGIFLSLFLFQTFLFFFQFSCLSCFSLYRLFKMTFFSVKAKHFLQMGVCLDFMF